MSHLVLPSLPVLSEPASTSKPATGNHGHKDLVQAVSFNTYGDRCATGSADGRIRIFNRQRDGTWKLYDEWHGHGSEVLELQWLPVSIYPSLLASLGMGGHFKIWAENPTHPPTRLFSSSPTSLRPAYEDRHKRAPYRSFSMHHDADTRHTYLALVTADGDLCLQEFETPEALHIMTEVDEVRVCKKPVRGEEVAFKVCFDPNGMPCYAAVRAGVAVDSLAIVVAAMEGVKVYRTKDVIKTTLGDAQTAKALYLAADIHVSDKAVLVRDVAWAPGNIRGYDVVAAACQDGSVRVFRLEVPMRLDDGRSWAMHYMTKTPQTGPGAAPPGLPSHSSSLTNVSSGGQNNGATSQSQPALTHNNSGLAASFSRAGSGLTSSTNPSTVGKEREETVSNNKEGEIAYLIREVSRLEHHQSPVWRVGFDDDGQILGSVGDSGRLICFRQMPNGGWAKSSEMKMERRE